MPRDRLSPLDASFLYLDGEVTCNQAVGLNFAEGPIDFERVVDEMQRKVRYVDRLRQCAVFAPLNLFRPTWEFDPAFNIRNHVKHVVIEPAGDWARFNETVSLIFRTRLDRKHPLWAVYVISGAPGGRDAHLVVLHHCVTDGIGFAKLAMAMFDAERNLDLEAWRPPRVKKLPSTLARMVFAAGDAIATTPAALAGLLGSAGSLASHYVGGKGRAARAMLHEFRHTPGVRFPFNAPLSGDASFSFTRFRIEDIARIRASQGGTLNDVLLAMVGTAMHRYAEKHAIEAAGKYLRVLVPSNVRTTETRDAYGNFVSMAPVLVPLDAMTTRKRLQSVVTYTRRMKDSDLAHVVSQGISLAQSLLPSPLSYWAHHRFSSVAEQRKDARGGRLPKFNLVVTNVPGSPQPSYVAGQELRDTYVLVPLLASIGLCCGALSNNGILYISFSGDKATVPDVEILAEYVKDAFGELLA